MSWGPFFFVFFVVSFFSVCIPAGVISYYYLKNGKGSDLMSHQAASHLGLAVCFGCMLVANAFGFEGPKPVYTIGYAMCWWFGIGVLAIIEVRHLLFLVRGGKR